MPEQDGYTVGDDGQYQERSLALPQWDQVADLWRRAYPTANQEEIRRRYEQTQLLSVQRERYRNAEETTAGTIFRRIIPFGSAATQAARTEAYGNAMRRLQAGNPQDDDYELIAAYERQQALDRNESAGVGLLRIPAMLGEAAVAGRMTGQAGLFGGGAQQALPQTVGQAARYAGQAAVTTAHMPSMWLPQWTEENVAAGRSPYDLKGLPRAVGLGTLNTMVLGSLSRIANDIPGRSLSDYLHRASVRTGYGLIEQQGVDLISGVLTHFADRPTGYGIAGDVIAGRHGQALQHALHQAVTFGAFSALHEVQHRPITQGAADVLREARSQGLSRQAAADRLQLINNTIVGENINNPEWTRNDAREAANRLNFPENSAARRHAETLAENFPFSRPSDVIDQQQFRADTEMLQQLNVPENLQQEFRQHQADLGRDRAVELLGESMQRHLENPPEQPVATAATGRQLVSSPMTPEQANLALAAEQARLERAGTPRDTSIDRQASRTIIDAQLEPAAPNRERLVRMLQRDALAAGSFSENFLRSKGWTESDIAAVKNMNLVRRGQAGHLELSPELARPAEPPAVQPEETEGPRFFHIADYKNPANSAAKAIEMLDRRSPLPYNLHVWDGPGAEGRHEANLGTRGLTSLEYGRNYYIGDIKEAGTGTSFARGQLPPRYDPALLRVNYRGKESDVGFKKLKKTLEAINAERANDQLMREYGLDGAIPPIELRATESAPASPGTALAVPFEPIKAATAATTPEHPPGTIGGMTAEQVNRRLAEDRAILERVQQATERPAIEAPPTEPVRETTTVQTESTPARSPETAVNAPPASPATVEPAGPEIAPQRRANAQEMAFLTDQLLKIRTREGGRGNVRREKYDKAYRELRKELPPELIDAADILYNSLRDDAYGESAPRGGSKRQKLDDISPDLAESIANANLTPVQERAVLGLLRNNSAAELGKQFKTSDTAVLDAAERGLRNLQKRDPHLWADIQKLDQVFQELRNESALGMRISGQGKFRKGTNLGKEDVHDLKRESVVNATDPNAPEPDHQTVTNSVEEIGQVAADIRSGGGNPYREIAERFPRIRSRMSGDEFQMFVDNHIEAYRVKQMAIQEAVNESIAAAREGRPSPIETPNADPAISQVQAEIAAAVRTHQEAAAREVAEGGGPAATVANSESSPAARQLSRVELAREFGPREIERPAVDDPALAAMRERYAKLKETNDKNQAELTRLENLPPEQQSIYYQSKLNRAKQNAARSERKIIDEYYRASDAHQAKGIGLDSFLGLLKEGGGYLDTRQVGQFFGKVWDKLKEKFRGFGDAWSELAGAQAPRTTRLSQKAGEALTQLNASGVHANEATPNWIDRILGRDAKPEDRIFFGAVLTERRLQHIRQAATAEFQKASDEAAVARVAGDKEATREAAKRATRWLNEAINVRSIVGQEGSPFKTQAEYQAALASPRFQEFRERWKEFVNEMMEPNYRKGQGLEETDPINSPTQVPGEPVNLRAILETDSPDAAGNVFMGGGRGNLKNPQQFKFAFANRARGAAELGYNVDLGKIIENTIGRGIQNANKANMYRVLESEGILTWAKPGERIDGSRELPNVKPPRGTQTAEANQTSAWIKNEAYNEVRRALAPDEPFKNETIRSISYVLTRATLASTLETLYHAKNLATFLFKPGVSFVDLVKNLWKTWQRDPATMQRLVELAEMGALKERGNESGVLWGGKFDPTYYLGNFLDFLQRGMRLTADQAFDRLAAGQYRLPFFDVQGGKPRVLDTETNRRDFINQLGNYNKRSQHQLVALLRDTGVGPFATASSNYYAQGIRSLFMGPGVEASSYGHAAGLRLEMLAKTLGFLAVIPVTNYLMHGRWDGDDNTPYGSILLGRRADGTSASINVATLTGVPRGARTLGIQGIMNGLSRGETTGQAIDRASHQVADSLMHAAMGPLVQFAHTLTTGRDALGRRIAERPGPEGSQFINNFVAALEHANPIVAAMTEQPRPGHDLPLSERMTRALGPLAPRYRSELDRFGEQWQAITNQRRQWEELRRTGQLFPREAEYRRMNAFHQAIERIQHAAEGRDSSGQRQGPKPSEERLRELRQLAVDVARRGLQKP